MTIYSIDIRGRMASFRYRMLMSGIQLTYEVPPPSTVLGLINAAAGKYLIHKGLKLGYYFAFGGKGLDTEMIYMRELNSKSVLVNTSRSNVVRREFLFDNHLRIYSNQKEIIEYLLNPVYPPLLGRSTELATVKNSSFMTRDLPVLPAAKYITGQVVPYNNNFLPGTLQALALNFTNTVPREEIKLEPYSVINCRESVAGNVQVIEDFINSKPVHVYLHEIDM